MEDTPSIYIIGAQCTGKTTLLEGVYQYIRRHEPSRPVSTIKELARGILVDADVNRDDIRAGSEKAMKFQRLVLEAQLEEELRLQSRGLIVSDRSGIDPIAYATMYGPSKYTKVLLEMPSWATLKQKMRRGVVILCEPVEGWLFDDGTRLMPKDKEEWIQLHQTFIALLEKTDIGFSLLPASRTSLEERVVFVLEKWKSKEGGP